MLEAASALFKSKGVKNVTVDEIARQLKMSKKTIYQHFNTKSQLVNSCVSWILEMKEREILQVLQLDSDPITEMLELGKLNVDTFRMFSKNTFKDLRSYYAESWALIESFKEKIIFPQLLSNLNTGIQQGLYRENIQANIVGYMYLGLLDSVIMQHSVLKTDVQLDEVYKEHLKMHMYSICSEKGRSSLEQYLNNF
ncbi:MAG TPA: TetR/AcrR family transcriptional regulator [Chitinophagales bacterium]|nr:TetR/AcrR family transcriptional regulator [Chitinophagales bacterium]